MTREELSALAINSVDKHKCTVLQWSTGVGKSKAAIDCVNFICDRVYKEHESPTSVLLLVAKGVHKENWKKEFDKWGINTDLITIECYESLKKYEDSYFDVIIADEAQHLSDARLEVLRTIHINESLILLSATLTKAMKEYFKDKYHADIISYNIQDAIEDEVLPEPTIYLLPLHFDHEVSEIIEKNVRCAVKNIVTCNWNERWSFIKNKQPVRIRCTKRQYLEELNNQIEWYKKKFMCTRSDIIKNRWLKLCNNRLKFLANCKNGIILSLLSQLKNYRTLTFCNSIEQAEVLGKNCIHSRNKESESILVDFNNKKIKHITSVNILNEGMNLTDCQFGIFANINASEIIVKQRFGRLLRHKNPIIIIPYYKGTREEELVEKMIEDYSPDLIKQITNINEIRL